MPGVTAQRLWVHRKLVIIIIPQQTIYYEFIALPQSPLSTIRHAGQPLPAAAISYYSDSGNKLLPAGTARPTQATLVLAGVES